MATNREKKKVIANITTEQAEQSFAEYSKAFSNIKKLEAEMDIKLTQVRENYSAALNNYNQIKEQHFAVLQTYALENEALFQKKKSIEFTHGVIGFRTGTPALKTLKGFTWESVKTLVKTLIDPKYIRTKEEVNKDMLLAERDNKAISDLFPKCGIEVKQDETFFVEAKEGEFVSA